MLGLFFWGGCQSQSLTPYNAYPTAVRRQVDFLCEQLAATHFMVRHQQMLLKKRHSEEFLTLQHYQPSLPDGYYFCTAQEKKSNLE